MFGDEDADNCGKGKHFLVVYDDKSVDVACEACVRRVKKWQKGTKLFDIGDDVSSSYF